jgi:hypothetical protein
MPEGLIFHILDDFLIIAQTEQLCKTYLEIFLEICSKIAPKKTVGPSTLLTFLGIELDTVRQEARLPLEKIQKCLSMVDMFLRRSKNSFNTNKSSLQPRLIFSRPLVNSNNRRRNAHPGSTT